MYLCCMIYKNIATARKETKLSYLGSVNSSSKIAKNGKIFNTDTYVMYLSPAKTSGYQVCAGSTFECRKACLSESGHARVSALSDNKIQKCRIKKTRLFFEERNYFMNWLVDEIKLAKAKAKKYGYKFNIRLNGVSDLSPQIFKLGNKNILDLFPKEMFYDYTKIANRITLSEKYKNYHVTYSYSGHNWNECETALNKGVNVAIVFKRLPKTYKGYKVVNGDISDMRIKDKKGVIVGLKLKLTNRVNNQSKSKFIIEENDIDCKYLFYN